MLKRDDIKLLTDKGSFERGEKYFKQGRVNRVLVDIGNGDNILLHSNVQGGNFHLYGQEIELTLNDDVIDIQGSCSCPVGYNCKHVVAACLEYTLLAEHKQQLNSEPSDPGLMWLDNFVNAGKVHESRNSSSEFIVYILQPSRNPNILSVQFKISRKLKKGGYGKPRKVETYNFSQNYMLPNYATDNDQEIAQLIELQDNAMMYNQQQLSGEIGYMTLTKMLNTGRCFWTDLENKPITHGKPRELQQNWHCDNNGDYRLLLSVEPNATIMITDPALYHDTKDNSIGKISGQNYNSKQFEMLLAEPSIPAESITQFSQQLLTDYPNLNLPAPKEFDTIHIHDQSPVPHLFVHTETINTDDGDMMLQTMRLRFAYGEHVLPFFPETQNRNIVTQNSLVSILRDFKQEKMAIDTLLESNFELYPDDDNNDIVFATHHDIEYLDSMGYWDNFINNVIPTLEAKGWNIEIDSSFNLNFYTADEWDIEIESDNDWFDLRFDLEVRGHKIPLLPLITDVVNNYDINELPETLLIPLSISDGQFLKIPSEKIRPICQILYELYDYTNLDDRGALRLSRFDATRLAELEEHCNSEIHWRGGKAMRELGRKLKNFKGIKKVAVPRGLKAQLRDYQQQGLNWLQFLRQYEFNGVLADDMGLGKTVQTLAHLLLEKERKRMDKPCLILAPTSLMSNWRREAQQFTPKLKVLVLQGSDRHQHFDTIADYDLILSTYPLLVRDHEILLSHEYHYLVLDEAQVIKNPLAKAAKMARKITARHRLCITGTPMENHLGELWALFDFLMPGFLGDSKLFKKQYRNPIERHGSEIQRERLVKRITPFLLRRDKSQVAKELPAKTEIIRSVALGNKQAALYESIRLSMEKKVRDAIKSKGLARSHITILDALLKLRQVCCDPQLLPLAHAKKVKESSKLDMLMSMVTELLEEGRRILIFSQFTKMLSIIEQQLKDNAIKYTKLTGQTRNREAVIDNFRQGNVDIFLISLKAGGVGLNLTEADTVIHYDPWWNPAVENQATDRVHRIGQDKAVFVYKLITENTLEEKIMAMQAKKQALADGVYSKSANKDNTEHKLNADDLKELFSPLT